MWISVNQLVCLAKPFLFSPLFRLYFIRRIYEYGDKVKLLFLLAVNYLVIPLAVLHFIAIFALRQLRNDKVGQYET